MNKYSFFGRLCCSQLPRRAAVMSVVLIWGSLAFCDEIHDAAQSGDTVKVKALLKDNPDLVFSKNTNGWTPLFSAAFHGHKDVVDVLLANKADVNAKDNDGRTLLHWMAAGSKNMVELLLTNNANVNARANDGTTPLDWAVYNGAHKKNGNTNVMELLLANKADVNATNYVNCQTPLHTAAWLGNKDEVELLLLYNADVNAKDNRGRTPLVTAEIYGHKDLAELLRQHGGHE
jgi:ankyrin repeat protein